MPTILVSYRRSDSMAIAGRIFDQLVSRYGADSVFIDYTQAVAGSDFREHLEQAVAVSDVFLAIVGPNWLGARSGGKNAIENEFDPVRVEIEAALGAQKAVIPVLVDGASMPPPADLPASLRNFSYQNAVVVSESDFQRCVDRIINVIDHLGGRTSNLRMRQASGHAESSQTEGRSDVIVASPMVPKISSPKIILSYRRSDSAGIAGRLFDRLRNRFGKDSVYMDIDSIPYGTNFRTHIAEALQDCRVLLAIVGPNWIGRRLWFKARIFDRNDPIRVEIETALRQKLPIIPVLLDQAEIPAASRLPADLQEFSDLNAAPLDSGRDFDQHAEKLMKSVAALLNRS